MYSDFERCDISREQFDDFYESLRSELQPEFELVNESVMSKIEQCYEHWKGLTCDEVADDENGDEVVDDENRDE